MNPRIEELLDSIDVNPKIRELAERSGCSIDKLGFGEGNLEKFAELIVRECADAIVKDSRLNDVRSAANGCVAVLKEHFGVEE